MKHWPVIAVVGVVLVAISIDATINGSRFLESADSVVGQLLSEAKAYVSVAD